MIKKVAKYIFQAGLPVPSVLKPVIRLIYLGGVAGVEGMVLLRKMLWIEPVLRSVAQNVGSNLRADRLPYIRGKGHLVFGNCVNLSGRSCFYFMTVPGETPEISLGNNVFVGNGCTFSAAQRIDIGNNVLISAGVRIHGNDGHPSDVEKRIRGDRIDTKDVVPVIISDGVWIGAESIILKGMKIGRNAVIGAGSVVTKDVPENVIVAGNPAIAVRRL